VGAVENPIAGRALASASIQQYGPKSETLSNLQLELLEEEPSATRDEVEAESRREPLDRTAAARAQTPSGPQAAAGESAAHRTSDCLRGAELQNLRRRDVHHRLRRSEVLDHEPARWFVRVTKREKRACGKCSTSRPELAPRIVEKGLASDTVVIHTVVAKYCDHLPLYRQQAILEREAGVEISRATLDGWVMRVGELLGPSWERCGAICSPSPIYRPTKHGSGADARPTRIRSSGVLVAIRQARRRNGVRLSVGPRARRSAQVPG
jgi:transposase